MEAETKDGANLWSVFGHVFPFPVTIMCCHGNCTVRTKPSLTWPIRCRHAVCTFQPQPEMWKPWVFMPGSQEESHGSPFRKGRSQGRVHTHAQKPLNYCLDCAPPWLPLQGSTVFTPSRLHHLLWPNSLIHNFLDVMGRRTVSRQGDRGMKQHGMFWKHLGL